MSQKIYHVVQGQDADLGAVTVDSLTVNGVAVQYGGNFYLDPTNGDDDNDGKSFGAAVKTWAVAKALLTTGLNQTLFLIGNSTGLTVTTGLTWDLDYTHLIGLCAPVMVGQRARITTSTATVTPLLTITGRGCIIKNLMFSNDGANAANLICVQLNSQSNYFENCYFGNGSPTNSITGGAALAFGGSTLALYNMFVNCTIGRSDTLCTGTYSALLFNGVNAKSTTFKGCHFTLQAGATTVAFVRLNTSGTGNDTYTLFDDCFFHNCNASAFTIASAFVIPAGQDASTREMNVRSNCDFWGVTDIDSGDTGVVKTRLGTYTAGGNAGINAATAAT